ncbi:MAG: hypothetical protein AAFY31_01145 [Pseudomonadota bacterium]
MKLVAELEAVLDAEQEVLLRGELGHLQSIYDRKLRLTERLASEKPDLPAEQYQTLKQRAEQNEALLQAAQRGLKAAISQISQASKATEQTTYSRSGERQSMSKSQSTLVQKL